MSATEFGRENMNQRETRSMRSKKMEKAKLEVPKARGLAQRGGRRGRVLSSITNVMPENRQPANPGQQQKKRKHQMAKKQTPQNQPETNSTNISVNMEDLTIPKDTEDLSGSKDMIDDTPSSDAGGAPAVQQKGEGGIQNLIENKHQDIPMVDDFIDDDDPQAVAEYENAIYVHLRSIEAKRLPNPRYMDQQRDINVKMREILIDWLSEVHLKFKLRPETNYITVNIIDRFLERRAVSRTKLQLVGCTAMLIASKYEEIYAPEVRDFVYISDKAYTREQILTMESIMLNTLQFNLTVPTALRFAERFLKLLRADDQFKHMVFYYMELTLQEFAFLDFVPSMVAASALYVALLVRDTQTMPNKPERNIWDERIERITTYHLSDIKICLCPLRKLAAKEPTKYRAVRKKYSSSKFLQVAKLPIPPLPFN